MSMSQPMEPSVPGGDDGIPAADPGAGAPEPAEGFGVGGEEPDVPADREDDGTTAAGEDSPFPTPDPDELGPDRTR
jgi:hypothetical protein